MKITCTTLIVTNSDIGRVATIMRRDPRVIRMAQIPGPSVHAGEETGISEDALLDQCTMSDF